MTVGYFNAFYFLYPAAGAAVFVVIWLALRGRSKKTQYWALFVFPAFNFILHFAKLGFPPYTQNMPYAIRQITPENLCAVSTLIFPFFFLSKKPLLFDYMFYLGLISGIAASFAPSSIAGLYVFSFDVMRYYVCHWSLWAMPLLTVILGVHRLDYRRIWKVPLIYFLVLTVIFVNEAIVSYFGLTEENTLEYLFDRDHHNNGCVFGLPTSLDDTFVTIIVRIFVPPFLLFKNPATGELFYFPVLWQVIPIYTAGGVYMTLLCSIWSRGQVRESLADLRSACAAERRKSMISRRKCRLKTKVWHTGDGYSLPAKHRGRRPLSGAKVYRRAV